jgi:hypothetical protein
MKESKMTHTYKEPYLPHPGSGLDGRSIDAGNQTLMRQAPMTANEYLLSAIDHIDQALGKGYAKQHPESLAAGQKRTGDGQNCKFAATQN